MSKKSNRGHQNLKKIVKADEILHDISGLQYGARSDYVRLVWKYIKDHYLQDAMDGRIVVPDYRLSKLMGQQGENFNAYKMLRHIEAHVIKDYDALDYEAWKHPAVEEPAQIHDVSGNQVEAHLAEPNDESEQQAEAHLEQPNDAFALQPSSFHHSF